jgi:hypothetical protein
VKEGQMQQTDWRGGKTASDRIAVKSAQELVIGPGDGTALILSRFGWRVRGLVVNAPLAIAPTPPLPDDDRPVA